MKIKSFVVVIIIILSISLCACSGNNDEPTLPNSESGKLTITFDYEKQSGMASNQFAVWVEDADGNYIKTLYVTEFTANGGYADRPSLPLWAEKSGVASMQKSEVDAITGATPKAGTLSYTWDLTDSNGDTVPSGKYHFFVEGSLRWLNRVIYSGVIEIGDNPTSVQADVEFIYESNEHQAKLSGDSAENSMIGTVTASFSPTDGN